MKKNAQDVAANKSDMSSDKDEIIQKNNSAKRSLKENKASELEPNMFSAEQKQSHVGAVPEENTKRKSVSDCVVGK